MVGITTTWGTVLELQHQEGWNHCYRRKFALIYLFPLPPWWKQLVTLTVQPSGYACSQDGVHLQFCSIQNNARWMSMFWTTFSACMVRDAPANISDQVEKLAQGKASQKTEQARTTYKESEKFGRRQPQQEPYYSAFPPCGPLQSTQPPCAQEFLFFREFCWTNLIF